MHILRQLLLMAALAGITHGQGVLLNAGDTWTYHFTTLDYVSTQAGSAAPFGASLLFTHELTGSPTNFIYEVFEGVAPNGLLGSGSQTIGDAGILLPTT